jgi:hypothetical protein
MGRCSFFTQSSFKPGACIRAKKTSEQTSGYSISGRNDLSQSIQERLLGRLGNSIQEKTIAPQHHFVSNDWGRINLELLKSNLRSSRDSHEHLTRKSRNSRPDVMQSVSQSHQRQQSTMSRRSTSKKHSDFEPVEKQTHKKKRSLHNLPSAIQMEPTSKHSLALMNFIKQDIIRNKQAAVQQMKPAKKALTGLSRAVLKKPTKSHAYSSTIEKPFN